MARLSPRLGYKNFRHCLIVDTEVGLGEDNAGVFLKLNHRVLASKEEGSWHHLTRCLNLTIPPHWLNCECRR